MSHQETVTEREARERRESQERETARKEAARDPARDPAREPLAHDAAGRVIPGQPSRRQAQTDEAARAAGEPNKTYPDSQQSSSPGVATPSYESDVVPGVPVKKPGQPTRPVTIPGAVPPHEKNK